MTSRNLFLSTVLATEGLYCVVGLKKGTPRQHFVGTVDEVNDLVSNLIEQGFDAYFGCAKFETDDGRTTKNAKWFKSFWLDLDCGESKPYETQATALEALKEFCKGTGLPKPTIVNSGRGIHAYWALTETISYNDWKPTAESLKKLCAENNLHADPSVTADAARILRVPDTLNFKNPDDPQRVAIVVTGPLVSISLIQDVLSKVEGVDIFAGDFYTIVTNDLFESRTLVAMGNEINNIKRFSTKKAAENYIKMNKPCLSLNDVLSITNKTSFVPEDFSKNLIKKELTKIVKQKLK